MRGGSKGTFSICAVDRAHGEVGCAVQSRYFAVGAVVPWVRAGVGAVATQAAGVAAYGPWALGRLEAGLDPAAAIADVLEGDRARETRRVGDGYAVQGNILAGEAVVRERLVGALEAAQTAGGDSRGQQSAAVVVERSGAAAESREGLDRVCDLRVDDHPEPIAELRRLLGLHLIWDALRRASARHEPGRYADGVTILAKALEQRGEDPVLLYDLACFETLAGDTEAALGHLARALALDPGLRQGAAADPDFAALADDERFRALVR
jgi:uncharacterized Ntn-hydrolase superfamily protein